MSKDDWELINKPPPIAELVQPHNQHRGRAWRSHHLQCLPPCYCLRFCCRFSFLCCCPPPLYCPCWLHQWQRAWCHCATSHTRPWPPLWLTFHHFPHSSQWISLSFTSLLFSLQFLWAGFFFIPPVGGREMGSKATYPSLFHTVTAWHSISVLSFCLNEHLPSHCHPN